MQDHSMQAQAQPFIKLAQNNIELLTRFSTSPEMTAQAHRFFQQATESATSLMQSGAFAQMMQGMMKNYSEFFMELNQTAVAMMGEGQAAMVQQVHEAGKNVLDVTDAHVRRSRRAA